MRVAIYGGAFDPPHLAHVFTITYLLTRDDVDAVWVLPAADHAFGKRMTAYAKRREMLEMLVEQLGTSRVRVDDIETESTGRTFDTLTLLSERHPSHAFTLVIGADNLTESHRWHRFDALVERFGVIALGRPGHERALAEAAKQPWCQAGPALPGVSSTRLRAALRGGDPEALRWLPPVLSEIAAPLYSDLAPRTDLPSVWIFGGGRLGTSLAAAWRAAGVDVRGVWRRSIDGELPAEAPADVWIVAVSDPAIPEMATRLSALPQPSFVLHCAGRFDASVLAPLSCALGSLHPLQSIGDDPGALRGAICAVEGAPKAVEVARQLAGAFGGRPVVVPSGEKPAYHAAAVVSANFMTTLAAAGIALLEAIGIDAPTARRMLTPLWQGTLSRNATLDASEALTGPMARGDLDAIQAHVAAIGRHAPQFSAAYAELARTTAAWLHWSEPAKAALDDALTPQTPPN